jgi:cyanophycinase
MARLLSALSNHPERLGIGIDEDTCAVFQKDEYIEVIGKGTVTIVDGQAMSYTNQGRVEPEQPLALHNLRVHILSYGDRYNRKTHQPTAGIIE